MTTTRHVPIAAPTVGDAEWQALREPIESGWLTQGPKVAEFEQAFAARHRVGHALAVTSCTTGLHLALHALGVGPGDEVVVPAFTWVASANVVVQCGATPVFVDVAPDTYNIDPDALAARLTERTRAVMAVHLFGLCADVDAIRRVVPHGVAIVEDAACAVGASYDGRSAGALGEIGVFSFHPRKIITTGEGGMVTTNDPALAAVVDRLRNHGASVPEEVRHHGPQPYLLPDFDTLGFNYRMTDLQGAVGVVQMQRLDGLLAERRSWAAWYQAQLEDLGWLTLPSTASGYDHGFQSYVAVVGRDAPAARNDLMKQLHEQGVSTRPGTHAVPGLGFYHERFGTSLDDYPVTKHLEQATMALPLHNQMAPTDYEYVVDCLRRL